MKLKFKLSKKARRFYRSSIAKPRECNWEGCHRVTNPVSGWCIVCKQQGEDRCNYCCSIYSFDCYGTDKHAANRSDDNQALVMEMHRDSVDPYVLGSW